MKKSNKILILSLVLLIVLATSITAYAFTVRTPAEIVAELTGKSAEEVAEIRYESGKTYGQIAYDESDDTFEQFKEEILENRKAILNERVEEGVLTQEEADKILEDIEVMQEDCLGTGGGGYGMGRGFGMMGKQFGNGNGFGNGGNRGMVFGGGRCGKGSW
jgi:hypothetical protein